MAKFVDFHDDLKLPGEAIAQIVGGIVNSALPFLG
jgi:hypothetical protein